MFHSVLVHFETRIVSVAAEEFKRHGIAVSTYEYDGVKIDKGHWDKKTVEEQGRNASGGRSSGFL